MAALGAALMGRVVIHTDAERAFHPWWDDLEDYLVYGLVLVGVVLVPSAIVTGTPLDCNYCQEDVCGTFSNDTHNVEFTNTGKEDPKFNAWWVKKYCTFNGSVDGFLLYYPYFLLMIALILFALERVFLKTFKAGDKLEKFYNLLVKEKVLGVADPEEDMAHDVVDGGVDAVELRYSFNPVVPGIFNKPGLPGGANLPHLLFCFVFTAARSADVLFQTKLSIDLDSKDAGVRIIFLIRLG